MLEHKVFYEWIDNAMEQLDFLVDNLSVNHPEIDNIYAHMFQVSEKMLVSFMNSGDERILTQIEKIQELMRKVKRLKSDVSAM